MGQEDLRLTGTAANLYQTLLGKICNEPPSKRGLQCKVYGSKERARSGENDEKDTDFEDEDDHYIHYGDDNDDDGDNDDDDVMMIMMMIRMMKMMMMMMMVMKKLSSQAWALLTLYRR